MKKILNSYAVFFSICLSALILFLCSSIRHALFQSNAWDLGIFDQAIYLISQGKQPISSFLGFHILGDHGALIFYPLALFYRLNPDIHWLFAIQAVALSLGAFPTYLLALHADLTGAQAKAMALVYLLYPLIFNLNLFDFHPEVIALPAILWAVLAAQKNQIGWFCLALVLILSCKAVLSLTVAAMGFWLLVFEQKQLAGSMALFLGIAWFLIATGVIIPFFGDEAAMVGRHFARYNHLGDSFREIITNFFFKPQLLLGAVFNLPNLEYVAIALIPLIWGLSPQYLTPLVGAFPALAMNILSNSSAQKNLVHQYSLPILPFLLLAVIATLAANKAWLQKPRYMILWALIAFLALGKYGYFGSLYLASLDTLQATKIALEQIITQGDVLTASQFAPHLTHRPVVKLAIEEADGIDVTQFDYVLLNQRHPGWESSADFVSKLVAELKQISALKLTYERDGVFLFEKVVNKSLK